MRQWWIENIEISLSLVGMLIIGITALAFSDNDADVWLMVAIVSFSLSLFNMLMVWFIRRRQRRFRQQAIVEIRTMLKDNVTNALAVISVNSQLSRQMEPKRRDRILASVAEIDHILDQISEDSLYSWQSRYDIQPKQ